MGIELLTGQPGHGKSYTSIRRLEEAMMSGCWVATNIPLVEDWAERMAAVHPRARWRKSMRPRIAANYRRRLYHVSDLGELERLRIPPCGKCRGCGDGRGCMREGRGLAVLDEAHKWLNSRTWNVDETGSGKTSTQATLVRKRVLDFFSTHRHRGWHVILITQRAKNLDPQVRGLYEIQTEVKNMKRFRAWGVIPVFPVNVFCAVTVWSDAARSRMGVRWYLLNKKLANCYDTMGMGRDVVLDAPGLIYLGGRAAHGLPELPAWAEAVAEEEDKAEEEGAGGADDDNADDDEKTADNREVSDAESV